MSHLYLQLKERYVILAYILSRSDLYRHLIKCSGKAESFAVENKTVVAVQSAKEHGSLIKFLLVRNITSKMLHGEFGTLGADTWRFCPSL